MRKLFVAFTILIILINFNATAQKCPRNFYDCRGACGWYIDTDKDGYCDYTAYTEALFQKLKRAKDSVSNLNKVEEVKVVDTITVKQKNVEKEITTNNDGVQEEEVSKPGCTFPGDKNNCPHKNSPACQKHLRQSGSPGQSEEQAVPAPTNNNNTYVPKKYHIITIFSACILLYLVTMFLARFNKIRKSTHRKIWNSLLLITFLVTGLLGLLLALQLNYQFWFSWFESLMYWHVQFGIGMAAISILHILWHWKYFKNLFKKHKENSN